MAADLTYDVQVNVSDATRNLDRLNTKVSNVSKAFTGLRNALAGVAIGSFITSTLRWADAISDLSDATGIAVQNIQGFSSAVVASGGNVEGAQKAILQLVQSIGEAADGSAKVQYAFEQVGVSLKDLSTLSEQQILQKTIDGLAGISDKAKQARLSNELLGKSLRGVELKGLAQAYPGATAEASASSSAIKAAAGAQQALERNLENLRVALVNVLEPLNKIAAQINITSDAFENLIKFVAGAAATYLFFTRAAAPLIGFFTGLGNRMLTVVYGSGLLASTMNLLSRAFYAVVGPLKNWWLAMKQIAQLSGFWNKALLAVAATLGILGKLFVRMLGWIGIIYTIAQAFAFLDKTLNDGKATKWLSSQWDGLIAKVSEYYNKAKQALGIGGAPAEQPRNPQPSGPTNPRRYPGQNEFVAGQAQAARDVADRNQELRASIIAVGEAYKNKTDDMRKSLSLDLAYLKMTEDEAAATRAYNEVMNEAQREIQALIDKKKALKPEEQSVIPTINAQIAAIRDRAEVSAAAAAQAVIDTNNFVHAQEQMRRELEITAQTARNNLDLEGMSAQLSTIGLVGDALADQNLKLQIEAETKQKILDIDLRRAEVQARLATIGQERVNQELANLDQEEAAVVDYAQRKYEIEKERLKKEQALRQNGAAGVAQYMEGLARSVDPFQVALDSVSSAFGNMESALDEFVRTGKFKFKDFAMSIIRDLIMIQLRAAITRMILAIVGLASGGPATAGKPYIVGENGPELFVPKSSGTVIPNNKLVGGGTNAGMGGPVQNTYITNNISAIDAKSVAQLFAENRKTLLGTVRYAQKEQSYRTATY